MSTRYIAWPECSLLVTWTPLADEMADDPGSQVASSLTAELPDLRSLYHPAPGFRPPPGYGSGGWGFESLAARQQTRRSAALPWGLGAAREGRRSGGCD